MAYLKPMRGKYYSIISIWNGVKQSSKTIPLKTKNKTDARLRHQIVEKYENDIKDGLDYLFPWQKKEGGKSTLIQRNLIDAFNDYIDYREGRARPQTIRRDIISFNQLTKYKNINKNMPIQHLSSQHIEGKNGLIKCMLNDSYSTVGINITLRHLKTFFNWLYKKDKSIKQKIVFDMLPEGRPLPRYLNENELKMIYNLDWLNEFYKKAFYFYENTGCRPSEPFLGELVGDWLIIESENSKGKNVRQIYLNNVLKSILTDMHDFRDYYKKNGSQNPNESSYHRISKMMRKSIKEIRPNLKDAKKISLKSLRHTYAIKRITLTGNIYQVSREMGHSRVSTTEIYLQYPEQKRISDFPSLKKYIEKSQEHLKKPIMDTYFMDTINIIS